MIRPESPYQGLHPKDWQKRTLELIKAHPLDTDELKDIALHAWIDILESSIGTRRFKIGRDIFPKPQIMAFFLHELIPLELLARYPKTWRGELKADEKDLVYIPDPKFSIEIKTSSHPSQIFGNRSYAQKPEIAKKSKSGYYLAINFEKFGEAKVSPQLTRIRFGWLDHNDWTGQTAATGQQARLSPIIERGKLIELFVHK